MGGVESNTPCIKSSGCGNFIHKLLKNHSANKLDEARQHRQRKRETERQGDEETERREDRETARQQAEYRVRQAAAFWAGGARE